MSVLAVSAMACRASEAFIYAPDMFSSVLIHLAVGGTLFLSTCLFVLLDEPVLKNWALEFIRRRKIE
jgi:hypothetical protein